MRIFLLTCLVLLAGILGCGGGGGGSNNPPPSITVTVNPNPISLTTGQVQTFTATVSGTSNKAVNWAVQEGSTGGSITSGGIYTAPAIAGTFHVVATSQANSSAFGKSTVTVAAAGQTGNIDGTIQ